MRRRQTDASYVPAKERYILNSSKEQVLEKLIVPPVVKKFPAFYWTRYLKIS
jgi:hypothetical protein